MIVISGYLNQDTMNALEDSGIRFTLEKPFRKARLLGVVETALAN